jgi:predicted CoA-binding protein
MAWRWKMASVKEDFLAERSIAVVGVSRTKGFGNMAFSELKKKGYHVYPVNQYATGLEGEKCYRSLDELPGPVGGVLTVVPPAQTEKVVADCVRLGIRRVWMQQGSESREAIRLCEENGISAVHSACILMYATPTSFHRFHRWVWKILGKL